MIPALRELWWPCTLATGVCIPNAILESPRLTILFIQMRIILWPDLRYHRVYSSSLPRSFTDESTSSCRMEPTSLSSLFPIVTSPYSFTISGHGCIQLEIKVVLIFWKMIYGLASKEVGLPVLYNLAATFQLLLCNLLLQLLPSLADELAIRDDSNSKLNHRNSSNFEANLKQAPRNSRADTCND